jgi:integrase
MTWVVLLYWLVSKSLKWNIQIPLGGVQRPWPKPAMRIYLRGHTFHVYFRSRGRTFRESAQTTDRSEALLYLSRRYAEESAQGSAPTSNRLTVGDAIGLWDAAIGGSKAKGWPAKRYGLVLLWSRWYGPTKAVQSLKSKEITAYAEYRTAKGFSPSTIQKDFASLSSFVRWLMHEEYVENNPVKGAKRPPLEKGKKKGLEIVDVRRLFDAIKGHPVLEPAYLLAFTQGFRRSEIAAARFEHVDLRRRTIYATGSKTDRSEWTLPLHPFLEKWLTVNWQESGPIVRKQRLRQGESEHYSPDSLDNYRKEANLRGMRLPNWHAGRHTLASSLVREGVDIFAVSKLLRHTQVTTTHAFYAHLKPETKRDELARFSF